MAMALSLTEPGHDEISNGVTMKRGGSFSGAHKANLNPNPNPNPNQVRTRSSLASIRSRDRSYSRSSCAVTLDTRCYP